MWIEYSKFDFQNLKEIEKVDIVALRSRFHFKEGLLHCKEMNSQLSTKSKKDWKLRTSTCHYLNLSISLSGVPSFQGALNHIKNLRNFPLQFLRLLTIYPPDKSTLLIYSRFI